MRLALSNIAWDVSEDEAVAELLTQYQVDAIDIAPGKYFPTPATATKADIQAVRDWWTDRGIALTGMQALLFGTTGLNVFGDAPTQEKLLTHLDAVCRIAGQLGSTRLVFGSPRNRDRSGLDDEQTLDIATAFFRKLGDVAHRHGVIICLEPNPPCYGANFMTTSAQTAHVVTHVDHPAIRMQLDTGAVCINGEDIANIVSTYAPLIGHVHISEPDLVPVGDGAADHAKIYEALQASLPDVLLSLEMLATKNEPHLTSIERAVTCAIAYYRPAQDASR